MNVILLSLFQSFLNFFAKTGEKKLLPNKFDFYTKSTIFFVSVSVKTNI